MPDKCELDDVLLKWLLLIGAVGSQSKSEG